jgi:hypothetical protein
MTAIVCCGCEGVPSSGNAYAFMVSALLLWLWWLLARWVLEVHV